MAKKRGEKDAPASKRKAGPAATGSKKGARRPATKVQVSPEPKPLRGKPASTKKRKTSPRKTSSSRARTSAPAVPSALTSSPLAEPVSASLPQSYSENRLTLLVRDPRTLHAHWDVNPAWFADLKKRYGARSMTTAPFTLRITPAGGKSSEIHVGHKKRSQYVEVSQPGIAYMAEIGFTSAAGQFHLIARSAPAYPPPSTPAAAGLPTRRHRYSEAAGLRASAPEPSLAIPSGTTSLVNQVALNGASDAYRR